MSNKDKIEAYYSIVDSSTQAKNGQFIVDVEATSQIANLFHTNGIYDRGKDRPPFIGKQAILKFFSQDRALAGVHEINSIDRHQGTHIPDPRMGEAHLTAPESYETIIVEGFFRGKAYVTQTDNEVRNITGDHGAELPFIDYWVFDGDKVLYRQSEIAPNLNKSANIAEDQRY